MHIKALVVSTSAFLCLKFQEIRLMCLKTLTSKVEIIQFY